MSSTESIDEITAGASCPRTRLAFIACREPSYSRVAILLEALSARHDVLAFVSTSKRYWFRITSIVIRFLMARLCGRLRDVDVLFVGFFAQPILPALKLIWWGPIIADGYFSIYDTLVNDKAKARPNSCLGKICYWLDRYMLRNADLVVTDTQEHVKYFQQSFNVPNSNVQRLWISAQESVFVRQEPLKLQSDDTYEVLFWGGFIPLQGVEVIIRAAALLRSEPVHFTIVGDGQTYDDCRQLSQDLKTDNVEFLGWQTIEKVRDLTTRAHLVLGIFGTTEKAARVIPNKAFEALALGKPLVTRDSHACRELLNDGRDAMLITPGNPEAIAEKIEWSRNNYAETLQIGNNGYRTFADNAGSASVRDLLDDYIQQVVLSATTDMTGVSE